MSLGFVYAIGAAIAWGLVYTIDQKLLSNTSPLALLFVLSVAGAIVLVPFALSDIGSIKTLLFSGKTNLLLMSISILLAVVANLFIFSAIKSLGASSASIIEIAYPFFVVIFSFIFFKTMPSAYTLIGGFLVFVGSAIIVYFN